MTTVHAQEQLQEIFGEGRAAIKAAFESPESFDFALYSAINGEYLRLLQEYPERPPISAVERLAAFTEGVAAELGATFRLLAANTPQITN